MSKYTYEGPRTPALAEWKATIELSRSVFFSNIPDYSEAVVKWPMFLRPETRENTFIMLHQGQPVSGINRLCRDIFVRAQPLRMGFVGSVCTHPDHRGKGLAGTVLDATLQRFADDDVDFVYISGARSLYYRLGANHVGGHPVFHLAPGAQGSVDMKVNIRKANLADAEILRALSKTEDTRFVRDVLDYELVLQYGCCSGGICIFNIIEVDSKPVAYVAARSISHNNGKWSQKVMEFAGDREAILPALVAMANENGANGHLIIDTRPEDPLTEKLKDISSQQAPGKTGGTIKLPNFTRTMEKLRPYFSYHLGASFAESLEFVAGGGRYIISGEGGALEIDGESNMLWTLLGSPPEIESQNVRATGLMENAMKTCLPLPLPDLSINTI